MLYRYISHASPRGLLVRRNAPELALRVVPEGVQEARLDDQCHVVFPAPERRHGLGAIKFAENPPCNFEKR